MMKHVVVIHSDMVTADDLAIRPEPGWYWFVYMEGYSDDKAKGPFATKIEAIEDARRNVA